MTEHVRVVVVGAGIAGLGLAMRLVDAGVDDVLVLERSDGVGGTWHDNVYPGVACDIPSHLYSYSFAPDPGWTRRYAPGAEIRDYLERCAARVREHLRLQTTLRAAAWHSDTATWHLDTTGGGLVADVLVLAVGRLAEPRIPPVPGLDTFPGPVLHTARWEPGTVVAGQRVGIVGAGASAVQLAPRLAQEGAHVTVLQRSAPWIVPRADHEYSAGLRARFAADDTVRAAHRESLFQEQERGFDARRLGTPALAALRERALAHLHAQVSDPGLRAALAPTTEIGCKRILLSDDYYPAVEAGAVDIVPSALAAIDGPSAIAESGRRIDLDLLVLATGFVTDRPPIARSVVGTAMSLAAAWRDGMRAFASVAVPGFPDLFVLDGPHAALGHNSAVHMIETQIAYVLGAIEHITRGVVLDVDPAAERAYTADIEARAVGTVWRTCDSWYRDGRSGRLTLLWPGTAHAFRTENGRFDPAPYGPPARR